MARKSKKKKVGPKSKLTPELHKEFVDLIKAGNYIETACVTVGINKSTYYRWLKKADQSNRYDRYKKFQADVEQAMAIAEARDIIIISIAAEHDWKAAVWLLEHRFTDNWGIPPKGGC